jgi:hypothetical protein
MFSSQEDLLDHRYHGDPAMLVFYCQVLVLTLSVYTAGLARVRSHLMQEQIAINRRDVVLLAKRGVSMAYVTQLKGLKTENLAI